MDKLNKIDELFEFINNKNFGYVIKHTDIEKILGLSRELRKYGAYLRQVRLKLVYKSKILKSIPGVGYQILTPSQVSGYTYRQYIKRTLNMYNASKEILDNLQIETLTKERMHEYNDVKELNNRLKDLSTKTIKESHYFSRKEYYDSLKEAN